MKVAYFLGALNRGGMETLLLDVFRRSREVSYQMICVYREDGQLSENYASLGISMYKLTPRKGFDFAYLRSLRKYFLSQHVDIVHAQHPLEACYAWLACLGTRIKIVQSFHGYDFHQTRKGHLILKWMIHRVDLNIFVSETQKRYYVRKYALSSSEKQAVVYNGVDFNRLYVGEKDEMFRETGKLILGSVGNFVQGRDQLTICRFLACLKQKGIAFRFLFIGKKDNHQPQLYDCCIRFCREHNLEDDVLFLGGREDVASILSQLDAFIYATDHDTFGIAVVEAIAMGIPVFVNDWEVMREITNEGELATLYRTKEEAHLLTRFMDFVENPEFYKQKARQSAETIKTKYSITRHVKTLEQHYRALLSNI